MRLERVTLHPQAPKERQLDPSARQVTVARSGASAHRCRTPNLRCTFARHPGQEASHGLLDLPTQRKLLTRYCGVVPDEEATWYGPRTLTSVRQVCIPIELLRAIGLDAGGKVHFALSDDGNEIRLRPVKAREGPHERRGKSE